MEKLARKKNELVVTQLRVYAPERKNPSFHLEKDDGIGMAATVVSVMA